MDSAADRAAPRGEGESDMTILPRWSHETKPYWDALRSGKLLYQRCLDCDEVVFHPRAICPYCLGGALAWRESNGAGRIYSFAVQHRAPTPERQGEMPIALGIVEMDEGFHMFTEFVTTDLESLEIGLQVSATYHKVSDELVLPKFAPIAQRGGKKGDAS
jgi:uncharacterized OB-fold protein